MDEMLFFYHRIWFIKYLITYAIYSFKVVITNFFSKIINYNKLLNYVIQIVMQL